MRLEQTRIRNSFYLSFANGINTILPPFGFSLSYGLCDLKLNFSGIVRVIAGWIGDRPCVTRNILAGAASLYCGVLTIISLSFRTFPTMLLFMLLFGLGGGKSLLFISNIKFLHVHNVAWYLPSNIEIT